MNVTVAVLAVLLAAPVPKWPAGHPYDREQHEKAPAEMWMLVEIPLGSAVKYELDKATGAVYVDRFQSMPVMAPANYGSFPRTIAADGDPLDAVMVSRHPVQAGAFVRVRPVGAIRTMDGQQPDDKILVVPVHDIDPTYDAVRDLKDVPAAERDRIAAYFRVYKQLPDAIEGRIVESLGREAAEAMIRGAMADYRAGTGRR
jgi:inorganic pyrophosphatase